MVNKHREINSYLVKISDRNLIRFSLAELKAISSGKKARDVITSGLRKSLYRIGVLKIVRRKPGYARVAVDWDLVREYLGYDHLA
jgi:hypothetical protein